MFLTEEASRCVQTGSFRDEEELLLRCIEERSLDALRAVQILYEDMYGGHTYNYEQKAPAASAATSAPRTEREDRLGFL